MQTKIYFYRLCVLAIGIALGCSLSGCFTLVATGGFSANGFSETTSYPNKALLTDTLLALGMPVANRVPSDAEPLAGSQTMALFGQSQTYLLTKGGDKLSAVAKLFAANPRLSAKKLQINDQHGLFLEGDTAWGKIDFRYDLFSGESGNQLTEVKALKDAGFKFCGSDFCFIIEIEAAVKPPVDFSAMALPKFYETRQLVFYQPNSARQETKPNLGRIALMPLSLVADVVTSPLQLLGLATFSYIFKDGMKLNPMN